MLFLGCFLAKSEPPSSWRHKRATNLIHLVLPAQIEWVIKVSTCCFAWCQVLQSFLKVRPIIAKLKWYCVMRARNFNDQSISKQSTTTTKIITRTRLHYMTPAKRPIIILDTRPEWSEVNSKSQKWIENQFERIKSFEHNSSSTRTILQPRVIFQPKWK